MYFLATLTATAGVRRCDREIRQARWVAPDKVFGLISDAPTRVTLFKNLMYFVARGGQRSPGTIATTARPARPVGVYRRDEAAGIA